MKRYYLKRDALLPIVVDGYYHNGLFYDNLGYLIDEHLYETRNKALDEQISFLESDINQLRGSFDLQT